MVSAGVTAYDDYTYGTNLLAISNASSILDGKGGTGGEYSYSTWSYGVNALPATSSDDVSTLNTFVPYGWGNYGNEITELNSNDGLSFEGYELSVKDVSDTAVVPTGAEPPDIDAPYQVQTVTAFGYNIDIYYQQYVWVDLGPASAELLTTGADTVDFNNLTADQQAAVAGGADLYDGLGGDDVVTLPSAANSNESVGDGKTLGWDSSQTFSTGSLAGQTYTVYGSDGSYNIALGAGKDTVAITGNGSSAITGGAGDDTIAITGAGANTITIGAGTDTVTINGVGANTVSAGTSSAGITITDFSGSLTASAPSPSPGATVELTGADAGNVTIGSNSTLELAAGSSLNGTITFGSASGGTLKIDGTTMPTGSINGFQIGDNIDLQGLSFSALQSAATPVLLEEPNQFSIEGTSQSPLLGVQGLHDAILTQTSPGGTDIKDVSSPVDAAATAKSFLDAGDTLVNLVASIVDSSDARSFSQFQETFGPVFAAANATADAAVIYLKAQQTFSEPIATPEQITQVWASATTEALDLMAETAVAGLLTLGVTALGAGIAVAAVEGSALGVFLLAIDAAYSTLPVPILFGAAVAGEGAYHSFWVNYIKPNLDPLLERKFTSKLGATVGVALDGYISGATVFADANGNGKLDTGEVSTMSDANGNFALVSGADPIIVFGGTDILTGLPFNGQLEAPSGSTVITPLTTLVSGLQRTAGLTVAAAEQGVLAALSLPSTADLTTLDPIGGSKLGDTVSADAYAAGAKVIDTADAIASAFETVGTSFLNVFQSAYAALDSDIGTLAAGQSLDLSDQKTIAGLINTVANDVGVSASAFASSLSASIAASNSAIDQKLAQDGASPSLITDVSSVQEAVQSPSTILWQNANGQAAIWDMNGTSVTAGGTVSLNPGPSWKTIATGDFFGGGHSDLLWQNADGQAAIWNMSGTSLIGGGTVGPNPGSAWRAVGTGDFNGDGLSDILWQNADGQAAIWEMAGTNVVGGGSVSLNPGPAWKAVGTGDLNGDGQSDILFQNASSGQVAIWEMNGNSVIGGGTVSVDPGPAWKAIGTGDFNDDGHSDILFQNPGSGQVAIWEMNGSALIGGGVLSADPGPSWHAIGTGGERSSDILFQSASGQAAIWDMNGTNITGGGVVAANPGSSWKAIGLG